MPTAKKPTTPKIVKATAKVAAPKVVKVAAKKDSTTEIKTAPKKTGALSVSVYSLTGKASGVMELPKEVFGVEVNRALLAQAMRVYINNERAHHSHTKTRGEVEGSTAKMGPQKGGGRARHGSKRAPIYRGGGIALGPKYRKVELELPQKMRRAALLSALSLRANEKAVFGIAGLDKASGKTKEVATFLQAAEKKSVLMIVDGKAEAFRRAVKNIKGAHLMSANQLNAYEIIKHQNLIMTSEAVKALVGGDK